MNTEINRLIHYGLQKKLFTKEDKSYVINLLLDVLKEESIKEIEVNEELPVATDILEALLKKAIKKGLLEDTFSERDLFDTRIMGCLMPRPSEVIHTFYKLYQQAPKKATTYYYDLAIVSNYIRKDRIDKNILYTQFYKYGEMEITINLSKPEKDPKEIAKAKLVKSTGYPTCLLCKENVGFAGNMKVPARQNHRIIPIALDSTKYYLQYSPYVYYNEHCIVLHEQHTPMVINEETFSHLLSFVEQFPHYMIGSNADLPIVGGSILSHDHFQGGNHRFPIERAEVIETYTISKYPNVKVEMLHWPLSTIRITSVNKEECLLLAGEILEKWKLYSDEESAIYAYTGTQRHNTITPIARRKEEAFQMDLVLRNNRVDEQYPDGIFHPHQEHHHIKKENIGLIEVMGIAILPARLKEELSLLEACLLGAKEIDAYPELKKHAPWYATLKRQHIFTEENSNAILKKEVTIKFVNVLEDAGVFKMNAQGIQAFSKFMKIVEGNT